MSEVNRPQVVAELTAIYERYERALVTNDVPVLQELFWNSPLAIRFGATENLHGYAEIEAFRRSRPAVNLERTIERQDVVTFGDDTGCVTIEFARTTPAGVRHGRQSQFWRKFPEGWRIVSAHVSLLPV
jgi:hypothetical protein